jgi:sensor histidine kinase YesM
MPHYFKNIFCILLFISMTCFAITAQNNPVNSKKLPFTIFKTTNDSLTLNTIINSDYEFSNPDTFIEKTKPSEIYWVKIDFQNQLTALKQDSIWYLTFKNFGYASIFSQKNDKLVEKQFGVFNASDKNRSIINKPGIAFKTNSLIDQKYLFIKLQRVAYNENIKNWKISYRSQSKNNLMTNYYSWSNIQKLIPVYVFSGICLCMFIFMLIFFVYTKKLEFLFYLLYILALFLYLTADVLKLYEFLFGVKNLFSYSFFQLMQIVINLCYVIFIIHYLNTKKNYTLLHKVIKYIVVILSLIILIDIYSFVFKQFIIHIYVLDIQRLIMTIFGIFGMIYLLIKAKNSLAYFIISGSFFYMIGALGLLFLRDRLYMITGSSLEILIFAAGLTYKIQEEYKEKLRFQKEAFINKSKALRAQINPHFIFNSLSSIQHLITSNDKKSALKYLSKFSNLTRNILEGSIETKVLLADEIKMLNDYLELESLRFEDAFDYQINIDKNIDPNAIEVPALIVQPFVENAILHGLINKQGNDKKLIISYKEETNFLICEIDDNGIGRKATSKKESIHKSRGVEVTQERLKILNELDENIKYVETIDKYDDVGNSTGTKVIIRIAIE